MVFDFDPAEPVSTPKDIPPSSNAASKPVAITKAPANVTPETKDHNSNGVPIHSGANSPTPKKSGTEAPESVYSNDLYDSDRSVSSEDRQKIRKEPIILAWRGGGEPDPSVKTTASTQNSTSTRLGGHGSQEKTQMPKDHNSKTLSNGKKDTTTQPTKGQSNIRQILDPEADEGFFSKKEGKAQQANLQSQVEEEETYSATESLLDPMEEIRVADADDIQSEYEDYPSSEVSSTSSATVKTLPTTPKTTNTEQQDVSTNIWAAKKIARQSNTQENQRENTAERRAKASSNVNQNGELASSDARETFLPDAATNMPPPLESQDMNSVVAIKPISTNKLASAMKSTERASKDHNPNMEITFPESNPTSSQSQPTPKITGVSTFRRAEVEDDVEEQQVQFFPTAGRVVEELNIPSSNTEATPKNNSTPIVGRGNGRITEYTDGGQVTIDIDYIEAEPLSPKAKDKATSEPSKEQHKALESTPAPRKPWYKRTILSHSRPLEISSAEASLHSDNDTDSEISRTDDHSSSSRFSKPKSIIETLKRLFTRNLEAYSEGFITAFVIKGGEYHQIPYNGDFGADKLRLRREKLNHMWKDFAFLSKEEMCALMEIVEDTKEHSKGIVELKRLKKAKFQFWSTSKQVLVAIVKNVEANQDSKTGDTASSQESKPKDVRTTEELNHDYFFYAAYTIQVPDPHNPVPGSADMKSTYRREAFSESKIKHRIRSLNAAGSDCMKKKLGLLISQNEEIEKLLKEMAQKEQHVGYVWTLAQLDCHDGASQGLRSITVYLKRLSLQPKTDVEGKSGETSLPILENVPSKAGSSTARSTVTFQDQPGSSRRAGLNQQRDRAGERVQPQSLGGEGSRDSRYNAVFGPSQERAREGQPYVRSFDYGNYSQAGRRQSNFPTQPYSAGRPDPFSQPGVPEAPYIDRNPSASRPTPPPPPIQRPSTVIRPENFEYTRVGEQTGLPGYRQIVRQPPREPNSGRHPPSRLALPYTSDTSTRRSYGGYYDDEHNTSIYTDPPREMIRYPGQPEPVIINKIYNDYNEDEHSHFGGPRSHYSGVSRDAVPQRPRMPYPDYYDSKSFNPFDLSAAEEGGKDIVQKLLQDWTPAGEKEKKETKGKGKEKEDDGSSDEEAKKEKKEEEEIEEEDSDSDEDWDYGGVRLDDTTRSMHGRGIPQMGPIRGKPSAKYLFLTPKTNHVLGPSHHTQPYSVLVNNTKSYSDYSRYRGPVPPVESEFPPHHLHIPFKTNMP